MLMNDYLMHIGVGHEDGPPGRGSGRYAYGSGENPGQHQYSFSDRVKDLKAKGLSNKEIAQALIGEKATSNDLKIKIAIEDARARQANREKALKLYESGKGYSEIGRIMGKNESSIRTLLDPEIAARTDRYQNTADFLKKQIEKKGIIDISSDTELEMGVSRHTLDVAVAMLAEEGYIKSYVKIPQATTKHETSIKVLAPPGMSYSDIQKNKTNLKPVQDYTPDEGKTWWTPKEPESIDSKRIMVRYDEEGGTEKDGVIELRRGVEDISLGNSTYAQVRIAVDGTHYMKGMAIYGDDKDFPPGVDVIYNSNKKLGTPMKSDDGGSEVLKRMKINEQTGEIDKENPFGALIKSPKERDGVIMAGGQSTYIGKDGKEHLRVINKLQDEGDWDTWSKTLSSQFLSKQPIKLINQQIDLTLKQKALELDKIKNLTNDVVKKKLLEDFALSADKNAANLKVRGFKNQNFQVLIPIPSLKDNECYAPNYKDGDTIALVRFPHGGTFEIPLLKVNNKHPDAKCLLGNAQDCIAINQKNAERLSGADFDGDTAIGIPVTSNRLQIKSTPPLQDLVGFNPKMYKLPDDAPPIKNRTKQNQMGQVTNLITDMTVGGANESEIARAVKHSMVVIDSEKHHLDYKQSAKDYRITDLKITYQGTNAKGQPKGASTIFSRANSNVYVPERKEVNDLSKMTPSEQKRWKNGEVIYHNTGATKLKRITDPKDMTPKELEAHKAGKKVYRDTGDLKMEQVAQMYTVNDARDLVRDKANIKEMAYADYANALKSMANDARKTLRSTPNPKMDPTAKATYAKEVKELNAEIKRARTNNPKERMAQALAYNMYSETFRQNPSMDAEHRGREKARCITKARSIVGAQKYEIKVTDKQWEAIQSGAISANKISQILNNTNMDKIKDRAMPKQSSSKGLTNAQISLIKSMSSSGMYTQKDIADALGISTTSVSNAIRNN